jgi:hypothetical protein
MPDYLITIDEVPFWTIVPFVIVLVATIWATVSWIFTHPKPE